MTYAFTFDASACSGCKACQVACKDKNDLPVGVLWRRVYEVSGGSWEHRGSAWTTDVFAYNLSMACNHCVHPKCAGVCPVDAYVVRDDGIVTIDESKCMGCGYCSWACPYAAPRYNHELRHMTKCNLCCDNLDAGLPPACVAACPLRVLELVKIEEQEVGSEGVALWLLPGSEHPFPLPNRSRTEPHIAINPHAGMLNGIEKSISNQEEFKIWNGKSELPLVFFTLLSQMAAGIAIFSLFSGPLTVPTRIMLGGLICISGFISLLHLGTPLNAWRAIFHLKKSWLSREILFFGLFGASWLLSLFMPGMGKVPLALSGIGFVYSMSQVYRLRSIPAWDSWCTNTEFFVTALLLGYLFTIFHSPSSTLWILGLLFAIQFTVLLSTQEKVYQMIYRLRLGLVMGTLIGVMFMILIMDSIGVFGLVLISTTALMEEGIGRWLFYMRPNHRDL